MRSLKLAVVAALVAAFSMLPAPADQSLPPASAAQRAPLPVRTDSSGTTTAILIEDLPGGAYDYSEDFATLKGSPILPPPDGRPYGVYTYDWSDRADGRRVEIQSVGLWQQVAGERVHVPMLAVENHRFSMDQAIDLVGSEASWFDHSWPLIVDMLMPDSRQTPSFTASYPRESGAYRWNRTVYVWYARKAVGGPVMWTGFYAKQTGKIVSKESAWHRLEIGAATRNGERTALTPAAYSRYDARRKETKTSVFIDATYVAGLCTPAGDVPLARMRIAQRRDDGDAPFDHADSHAGEMQIGTESQGKFVPLLGLRTTQKIKRGSDLTNDRARIPTAETWRESTIGVYGTSGFVPVLGVRYHGERQPQDIWIAEHIYGGGPGDQRTGDWEIDSGVYPGGVWMPVAGATYDDDFSGHHFRFRAMTTVGTFVSSVYRPVVGSTYDGQVPLLAAAARIDQGDPGRYPRWEVSAGAFPLGEYAPATGLRFEPGVSGGSRKHQWRVIAGFYTLTYSSFTPVAYATYDGDQAAGRWAGYMQGERLYGLYWDEGTWDITAGAFIAGQPLPLLDLAYRTSAPDGKPRPGHVSSIIIGVFVPGFADATPLAAVTLWGKDGIREKNARFDAEVATMQPAYMPIACATITVEPYSAMPRLCG